MNAKRTLYAMLALGIPVSAAFADATIELTALTPQNAAGGYLPNTTVEFEVAVSTDRDDPIAIRLLTLVFQASSPELRFTGPDDDPQSGGSGNAEFVFDFSTILAGALYAKFPHYPKPNITYQSGTATRDFILVIPGRNDGSLVVGRGSVILPQDQYGDFYVDALNAGATDHSSSARLDFDFVNPTTWMANGLGQGLISGDPLVLTVVPEPATLVLLGLGGLVAASRRRRAFADSAGAHPAGRALHNSG